MEGKSRGGLRSLSKWPSSPPSSSSSSSSGRSFDVPESALERVMGYIEDPRDRDAISLVCKRWYRIDAVTRKHITIALCYSTRPESLTRRFPGLESLRLKGKPRAAMFNLIPEDWGGYAGPWIREIAGAFHCLKDIHFRRMIVTDHDIQVLVQSRCRTLVALALDRCSGFSTNALKALARSCSDAYEGIRAATEADLLEIKQLFQPLEKCGALVLRTAEELQESLGSFIIAERDGSIVACAALFPYFVEGCAEVASFAISPDLCGNGQERNLLDYVERKAASLGLHKLFLLTTCTSDWFVRRGFVECNVDAIPRERRERIDLSRWSKYYIKSLRSDLGGSMSHQRVAQTF